jgi:hypothetical protein
MLQAEFPPKQNHGIYDNVLLRWINLQNQVHAEKIKRAVYREVSGNLKNRSLQSL